MAEVQTKRGMTRRAAAGAGVRGAAGAALAGGGLAPLLAACGSVPGQTPGAAKGGGEVRFLSWTTTWNQPMVPMFEQYTARTGTKITIEWETQADHDAKVTAHLAAGTAPDNEKVKYGNCAPYQGLKHPIQP